MQASDWLSKQLVDLQIKVETSQEKLVKYQKEHEILGIDEKQNIITSKLDELNKELTAAESARMEKESVYRLVQIRRPRRGWPRRHGFADASGGNAFFELSLLEKLARPGSGPEDPGGPTEHSIRTFLSQSRSAQQPAERSVIRKFRRR